MLYGRKFPPKPNLADYRSYVGPAILFRSEEWCLKESVMGILRTTERSMVRAMCGVQLKTKKDSMDRMFVLCLNNTMDQLAMANSVHWYNHVLRREDGHVLRREDSQILRRALVYEVEWSKKGWPKRTWRLKKKV